MNSFFYSKSEEMKKLIAGNWKMHGDKDFASGLAKGIINAVSNHLDKADILVCPPFVHIDAVANILKGSQVETGGQDCTYVEEGAYTGDVSANMLKDIGCSYVILGHSERRQYHGETSELVSKKAIAAHQAGLTTIICVGENEAERKNGQAQAVVGKQLEESLPSCATDQNTVIAYEPVWAIGSGLTAQPIDILTMHRFIYEKAQEKLESVSDLRILYGGSVKPENAAEILNTEHVHGALIGGASLKVESFLGIVSQI